MTTVAVREEGELARVAEALLESLRARTDAHVIALSGDLGAGKTALTKALAHALDVREHVTSPTFVIMKSYAIPHDVRFTTLTHVDAYRIDDENELTVLGFEELLGDEKRLIVIEWPERIPGLIPTNALRVSIAIGGGNERTITYEN